MVRALVVLKPAVSPHESADTLVISFDQLKDWVRSGSIVSRLLRFDDVRLITQRLETVHRPLLSALVIRGLSRRRCSIEDERGERLGVGIRSIAGLVRTFLADWVHKRSLLQAVSQDLRVLRLADKAYGPSPTLHLDRSPAYLRTDLVFGLTSGGSVGHIAGVLNNLAAFTGPPIFVTTDRIPTVGAGIETTVVLPEGRFRDFAELPSLAFNATVDREARRVLAGREVSFVYQRYSTENFAGLRLARDLGVPFVLEYNGSEIWINRNWGTPLVYEQLATDIELANLAGADLVVVVSAAMRDELVGRGVDGAKILVNPNGVDTDRYGPGVDGSGVRARYGLGDRLVVGFIGTFGKWHGAEVLADAFGTLVARRPELRERVRLLMIGDGLGLPAAREVVSRRRVAELTVFTGSTAQAEGPAHLAAADILVSPHVPNPDGTPFFGSPTKLFEYMAMGKPIVASDLDQIGEVLDHDETAWLVRPGDPDALATGIEVLIDDPARRTRLGEAARRRAVERHTWREHTRRIVEALRERCA